MVSFPSQQRPLQLFAPTATIGVSPFRSSRGSMVDRLGPAGCCLVDPMETAPAKSWNHPGLHPPDHRCRTLRTDAAHRAFSVSVRLPKTGDSFSHGSRAFRPGLPVSPQTVLSYRPNRCPIQSKRRLLSTTTIVLPSWPSTPSVNCSRSLRAKTMSTPITPSETARF